MRAHERIIALAGVFQSAWLVQQLARHDKVDEPAFSHSVNSILVTEAESAANVFGGITGIRRGLTILSEKMLGAGDTPDFELARYVLALVQLAVKLERQPQMLEAIATEIGLIRSQREMSGSPPFDTIDDLAQLYARTISTLTPRIIVSGEHGYLTDPRTASRVRAALMAGIRAAYLWQQLGGRRWQLIFARRRIGQEAVALLQELEVETNQTDGSSVG